MAREVAYKATEAQEQEWLFQWATAMRTLRWPELELMFHVPNGGSRNKVEAARLKAQGVKAGVPDIFLPVARKGWHGLFIELKRLVGGKVSPEQEMMIKRLNEQGYRAVVCKGWNAAADEIEKYMGGQRDGKPE